VQMVDSQNRKFSDKSLDESKVFRNTILLIFASD